MHHIVRLDFCFFVNCIFLLRQIPPVKAQIPGEGSVRLRRGSNSQSGYVEIFHSSQWGKVCDTAWDHIDAHVVCKQQGYNGAKFPAVVFTQPSNPGLPPVLDNFQCTGRETALADCEHKAWNQTANECQTARVECMSYAPQYIGCFADDFDRLLPDYSRHCEQGEHDVRCAGCDYTNTACDSPVMTVELCIEICCTDNNFIYAGVQAGDECYCGEASADYLRTQRLLEVLCNKQCSGNPQQSCGADYKIDVYDCSSGCEIPNVDKPNLVTSPVVSQTSLYKTGSMLTFTCAIAGYHLQGSASISCQPGGLWSALVPDCVETMSTEIPVISIPCSYPTTTSQNSQYLPVQVEYQPGATVQITCNVGYQTAGNPIQLICQSDGTWTTEEHTCTAVDCGPLPAFPNAIPSTNTTTYETKVTFTCEAGYQLSDATAGKTCDASGVWTGEDPQCAGGSTCGSPPFPRRGLLTPFRPSYQPGEAVKFSCFAGLEVVGAANATCRDDGTWSHSVPTCEVIDCGPLPEYPFVTPVTTATVFATSVTFRCDDSYQFANGATPFKTCNQDGLWVGINPVCELYSCPPLATYPHANQSTDVVVINAVVTFTCATGYELLDSDPAPAKICTSEGIWEGPDPVCQRSVCAPLESYANATISTNVTDIGTVVTWNCSEGAVNLLAPIQPTKKCSLDKEWIGIDPNCVVVDCGPPDMAFPDVVVNVTDYTFNSTVTYSCNNTDQVIQGDAVLYCLNNGNWSSDVPTCGDVSTGAESSGIPFSIWIVLLILIICLILLIASYIVYRVHTISYKKYKKETSDTPSVPLHGIAISDPHAVGRSNYAMSHDEEEDTGVASNESDMQDVSLGSDLNYRYQGNPYAESLHSGSVQPSGTNDSGVYPSDPESTSLDTDVADGAVGAQHSDTGKKDKDFVDDMLDSAKEKLDNCVIQ